MFTMTQLKLTHFIFALVCFYREVYEAKVSRFGNFMRLNEILSVILNMGLTIQIMNIFLTLDHFGYENLKDNYPPCAREYDQFILWAGNSKAWLMIEISVFAFYVITFVVLMIKSRFFRVGIDQKG